MAKRLNVTMIRLLLVLNAGLLGATVTASARAEPQRHVDTATQGDDYGYKFDDDSLLGSTLANSGDIFASRKRFQRVMLLRPRTDLIPQLFKSVENL